MKLLIASDSFKGSLSSLEIGKILKINNADKIVCMSDGGEGFVQSILFNDPSMKKVFFDTIDSKEKKIRIIGAVKNKDIYIDVASIIALHQYENISAFTKTTKGLGIVLKQIENSKKYDNVYIGLGGSSTNDLGFGAALALGFKFYNYNNEPITCFQNLKDLKFIKKPSLNCKYIGFSDVNNKLLGPKGSTKFFGPQKWLSKIEMSICENIFENFVNISNSTNHLKKGAGAAGGLGFFIYEFLNGKIESGIKKIIDISKLKEIHKNYDFIITGEGKIDSQSFFGKVPIEVAKISKNKTILIAGLIDIKNDQLKKYFFKTFQILKKNESVSSSIKNTPKRLKEIRNIIAGLKDSINK